MKKLTKAELPEIDRNHEYKIRFSAEPWEKPLPDDIQIKIDGPGEGTTCSPYGYTDALLIGSLVMEDNIVNNNCSLRLYADNAIPPIKILEVMRDKLNELILQEQLRN